MELAQLIAAAGEGLLSADGLTIGPDQIYVTVRSVGPENRAVVRVDNPEKFPDLCWAY